MRSFLSQVITPPIAALLTITGTAYFLDILFISLSGRFLSHYYLIIFPSAAILVAIFLSVIFKIPGSFRVKLAIRGVLTLAIITVVILSLANILSQYHVSRDPQREPVIAYVRSHTLPGDQVLMWGSEPVINFVTGRTRPNRYVFMTQLFLPGYANGEMAAEMLADLKAHPPKLIIYTRRCSVPFLDYKTQACVAILPEWQAVYDYIRQNYTPVVDLGPEKWDVYQFNQ